MCSRTCVGGGRVADMQPLPRCQQPVPAFGILVCDGDGKVHQGRVPVRRHGTVASTLQQIAGLALGGFRGVEVETAARG